MITTEFQITPKQIIVMIDAEIAWCEANQIEGNDEQKGFIGGLKQAKYLIAESEKTVKQEIDRLSGQFMFTV